MKNRVIVKDSNRFVFYKNRKIRSPFSLVIEGEAELKKFQAILRISDIRNFVVENLDKENIETTDIQKLIIPENKDVMIEELDIISDSKDNPETILQKLMETEGDE